MLFRFLLLRLIVALLSIVGTLFLADVLLEVTTGALLFGLSLDEMFGWLAQTWDGISRAYLGQAAR